MLILWSSQGDGRGGKLEGGNRAGAAFCLWGRRRWTVSGPPEGRPQSDPKPPPEFRRGNGGKQKEPTRRIKGSPGNRRIERGPKAPPVKRCELREDGEGLGMAQQWGGGGEEYFVGTKKPLLEVKGGV